MTAALKFDFTCYFDGACEPINPGGTGSYGAVILKNDKAIAEISKLCACAPEFTSNNVAEYSGLIALLEELRKRKLHAKRLLIRGDSQLVINQMFGNWQIGGGLYVPYAVKAKNLLEVFTHTHGEWVRREFNTIADELSKRVLREHGIGIRIR